MMWGFFQSVLVKASISCNTPWRKDSLQRERVKLDLTSPLWARAMMTVGMQPRRNCSTVTQVRLLWKQIV